MLQKTLQGASVSDRIASLARPLLNTPRRRTATSMSQKGTISDKQIVIVGANRGIGFEVGILVGMPTFHLHQSDLLPIFQ
jgi:hypothetical protein